MPASCLRLSQENPRRQRRLHSSRLQSRAIFVRARLVIKPNLHKTITNRLGFANSQAGTPSLMARERGFVAAAQAMGLDVIVERFCQTGYDSGRILANKLLTRKQRPDAIFCATDLLACGLMDAARRQFSMSIPEQLCIAGFDDIEQASWSSFGLTTFAQPVDNIAQEAMSWPMEQAHAEPENTSVRLHADLVWRTSVRGG